MGRYRKKPVEIDAVELKGANDPEFLDFAARFGMQSFSVSDDGAVVIHTLEGDMTADVGDYIIRGVKGEFYPCKADIFAQTYESVSDDAAR
jgi:hypothetical protein